MAAGLKFGMGIADDAESYMDAPSLPQGGGAGNSGNGSVIANVLDLLGIHRQVALGPKPQSKAVSNPSKLVKPEFAMAPPEPSNRPTSRDMGSDDYTPIFANQLLDSITDGIGIR